MMKNKRKEWKRIAAFTLAALLTVNSIDLSVFTAYAKETKEQTSAETKNAENTELTITGFADLQESIVNQQLAIGALEEEVVFPDTLEVTVSVSDAETKAAETEEIEETAETEESAETETEETTESEMEETEEETVETEEAETTNGEIAETEETETTGGEATKTGESASKEPGNEVNKSVQEADENTSQNTESENSSTEADVQEQKAETDTASLMDTIFSAFAPMTVYAAENKDDIVSENSTETTENAEIKEITLTDITWELNPAESDGEGFDSCEDCDGYCYVYTPVLPETDEDGNKITLGEGVEVPVIYVLIGEGKDHVSTIAVEGYDDEGFCEGYKWENGSIVKNGDGETQCTHTDCNGFQPATEESYDVNGDGTTAESEKAYKITNVGQLYWFAAYVNEGGDNLNANAYLANDIAINANLLDENGNVINGARKWTPIGNRGSSEALIYNGVFDGNNHTISNLYIAATKSYQGLFGDVNEKGVLKNFKITGNIEPATDVVRYVGGAAGGVHEISNVKSAVNIGSKNNVKRIFEYVGGVAGSAKDINNCCYTGKIDVSYAETVGGIAGESTGNITGCNNSGNVSGYQYIGGIVGNIQGNLTNCSNSGDIRGISHRKDGDSYADPVGGIAGKSTGNITGCNNSGNVSGDFEIGGIAGVLAGYNDTNFTNCSNSGNISGMTVLGGLFACVDGNYFNISDSYNTGKIISVGMPEGSANTPAVGGIASSVYVYDYSLKNCYYLETSADTGITYIYYEQTDEEIFRVTENQFASGEVAYRLNGSTAEGTLVWYQNIDSDTADNYPVLDSTHGTVYPCTPCTGVYSNTNGKEAEHVLIPDKDDPTKHICEICRESVNHSAVSFTADTDAHTITGKCVCGAECGTFTLNAPDADTLTYDDAEKVASVSGEIAGITEPTISYSQINENGTETSLEGKPTDAGEYKASISCGEGKNTATAYVTYEITQATPTVAWSKTSETVNYTANPIASDKILPALNVKGVGDTDIKSNYDTDDFTYFYRKSGDEAFTEGLPEDRGTYEIKATVHAKGNYNGAETTRNLTLKIDWLNTAETATLTDQNGKSHTGSNWWAQRVTFAAPSGFTISKDEDGIYTDSFTFDNNGTDTGSDGTSVTYYLKNSDGELAQKTQTVHIDHTAPTFPSDGGIKIKEHWFTSLLNTITFNLFYKENVDVTVNAEDALSGIASYHYWVDTSGSTTVLTAEELSEKTFTETDNDKIATTTQDGKYVYYVYVEDKAGNRSSYICSNGVVVDTAAPEVSVTTDTQDVTATLTVTATDTGSGLEGYYYLSYTTDYFDLSHMTVEMIISDGGTHIRATGKFPLTGLDCATTYYYAVVVKDKAGNAALKKGEFTTEKMMPEFDASDIPTISGTYGQKLSEMTLSKTTDTSENGIKGTWSITEADADSIYPTVNGTKKYEVTFTPTDGSKFDVYNAQITPYVTPKELTVSTVSVLGREFEPNNSKVDITVSLAGIVGDDQVEVANAGSLQGTIESPDAGTYDTVFLPTITLTGEDSDNYTLQDTSGEFALTSDVVISQKTCANKSVIKQYLFSKPYGNETIQLSDYLPEGCGTVNYGALKCTPEYAGIVSDYSISGDKLSYTVNQGDMNGGRATIEVTVDTKNYEQFKITIKIQHIDKYPVILQTGTSVTLKNNVLTYGESLSKLKFNTAVFVSQDNPNQIINGMLAWTNSADTPNAGIRSVQWTFTPDDSYDGEYASLSGTVSVIVNRATPDVVTAPAVEMSYNPNTELLGIDLNTADTNVTAGTVKGVNGSTLLGSWSWETPDQVPQVYNSGYKAIFTPSDTNYEPVTRTITVTVAKATPYIDADTLTAEEITYGQTLADSSVQGSVYYDSTKQTLVAGSFVWKNGSSKPTAKDDSNNTRYTVIFKPTDSDNYNEVETEITITVNKAQYAPNMPGSTMSVQNSITKVGDVTLPKDWVWQESDKDTALEVDVAQRATALYEGADKGNYEKESVEIILTRSACDHVPGEILYTGTGEHAPDCVNDGLGHRECTKCHAVMESGIVVAALGHQGGTATCKKKAVCTVCHQEYGSTNTDNHAATEIRGHKNADCTSAGYTGDTYCADCGAKISSGTAVSALGHKYKSVETTAPTTTSTGVRTYTCERCGYSYTETIAKLPEETHSHSYTENVTRQADCTNAGVKTYSCSCGDSYTESIPALGHHYISRVTKQATTTAEGIMTYTCDRCGHSYTRPIAKLSGNGQQGNTDKPDNNNPGNDNKPADNNKPGENNKPGDNSKPDTGKPYIEGHTEQNGWENIKDQLEKAKDKNTVTVEMNGTTVVPGDVFDSIRGKDVKVVFDLGDGITWTVNGKDITADKVGDIDFSVTVGSQAGNTIPVDIINNVTGERYSVNVTLAYDGEFGFTAILTLNVDKENAGLYANLFYYNPETAALEFMSAAQIDENGNAALEFTHASDYTVVLDTEVMSEEGTDDVLTDADENAAWNPLWVIVIGAVILIVGLGIFFAAKKKKEEAEK